MADIIYTEEGTAVPRIAITADLLLDRSIVLYGASGSGKTVFIKHLLDVLRGHVGQALLVSPSEPTNNAYRDYMPKALTHYTMKAPDPRAPRKMLEGDQGALQFLENMWQRQDMLVQIYEQANDLTTLRGLTARLPTGVQAKIQADLDPANRKRATTMAQLEKRYRGQPGELKEKRRKVNELFEQVERSMHKNTIIRHFAELWGVKGLTSAERVALQYIDLNPRMVLVLDDCGSDIKGIMNKPVFKRLFYRNRHVRLTVVFAFQDDTDLLPAMRKNAFISIFCERVSADALFMRGCNNFARDVKQKFKEIGPLVFQAGYRKLVYIRDDPNRANFYHCTAAPPTGHMFPCGAVLEFCQRVERSGASADPNNPYFSSFAIAPA